MTANNDSLQAALERLEEIDEQLMSGFNSRRTYYLVSYFHNI